MPRLVSVVVVVVCVGGGRRVWESGRENLGKKKQRYKTRVGQLKARDISGEGADEE